MNVFLYKGFNSSVGVNSLQYFPQKHRLKEQMQNLHLKAVGIPSWQCDTSHKNTTKPFWTSAHYGTSSITAFVHDIPLHLIQRFSAHSSNHINIPLLRLLGMPNLNGISTEIICADSSDDKNQTIALQELLSAKRAMSSQIHRRGTVQNAHHWLKQ